MGRSYMFIFPNEAWFSSVDMLSVMLMLVRFPG